MELTVHQLSQHEVYLDIVRIPEEYRRARNGVPIEEGKVCRLLCRGEEAYVIARGCSTRSDASIFLDAKTRDLLGVKLEESYEFDMSPADFCGHVRWAFRASDVRFSFPVRITLVSGGFGIALGILSVVLGLRGCWGTR